MAQQLTLVPNRTDHTPEEKKGSVRIRVARSVLCDLLMLDDSETEIVLAGPVSACLNEIVLQLDELAGRQQLFELWVG
jgi:hypothetical protein